MHVFTVAVSHQQRCILLLLHYVLVVDNFICSRTKELCDIKDKIINSWCFFFIFVSGYYLLGALWLKRTDESEDHKQIGKHVHSFEHLSVLGLSLLKGSFSIIGPVSTKCSLVCLCLSVVVGNKMQFGSQWKQHSFLKIKNEHHWMIHFVHLMNNKDAFCSLPQFLWAKINYETQFWQEYFITLNHQTIATVWADCWCRHEPVC